MIKLIKSTFYKESETKKLLCSFIRRSRQLSFGPMCERFEQMFAQWQGRKYCILLNSGSSANLAIIQTLVNLGKLKRGDKVGFSSVTWSTNVMPLIQLGLIPIPVDVEINTLNVSSNSLRSVLKHIKLKALFITHLLGFCGDIDSIQEICRRNDILLIEDNCESFGSVYKKIRLGNFGSMSSFSFYVGHHLSTVEGGAVCTDNEKLATMLRLVRAHGWDRNLSYAKQEEMRKKFKVNSTFYSRYTFYDLGYNMRPTEMTGLLGQIQLGFADEIIQKRKENFLLLADAINRNASKYFPLSYSHMDTVSNFAFPLVCRNQKIRDTLVKKCDQKVEIRPIVGGNMIKQPFFMKYVRTNSFKCPNAKIIHDQGLYFGNNPELTQQELRTLINIFS